MVTTVEGHAVFQPSAMKERPQAGPRPNKSGDRRSDGIPDEPKGGRVACL
jgi:hypothetical protein